MSAPDIRTARAKARDQRAAPQPRRVRPIPAPFLALAAGLACGALAHALGASTEIHPDAQRLALQTLAFIEGGDPRLIFGANTPYGAIVDGGPSGHQWHVLATLWTAFGATAFAWGAAIAASLLGLAFALVRPTPTGAAVGISLALAAVAAGAAQPLWALPATATALCALALGLCRHGPPAKAVAGALVAAALALDPNLAGLAAATALGVAWARRPNGRLAAAAGLGFGGLLVGGAAGLALLAIAGASVASGFAKPRWRGALYLALGTPGLVLGLAHTPLGFAPNIHTLGALLAALALGLLTASRAQTWKGFRLHPTWIAAHALMGVALAAALAGLPMAAWAGLLALAIVNPKGATGGLTAGAALCAGVVTLAAGPGQPTSPLSAGPWSCPDATIPNITAALQEAGVRRVLADPGTGWRLLASGAPVSVVGAGVDSASDADAQAAMETDDGAEHARRVALRRSVEAVVVCADAQNPGDGSLGGRLWNGGREAMEPMDSWITPLTEGEGYAIGRVVRDR